MKPQDLKQLLEKYLRGEATYEEKKFIDEWYNNISPGEHQPIPPDSDFEDKLWENIKPKGNSRQPFIQTSFLKIAASISVILLISSIFYLVIQDYLTHDVITVENIGRSELFSEEFSNSSRLRKEFVLQDGSTISLQPNSKIQFPKTFHQDKREVILKGEAFFNIKRDTLRPFFVYSKEVVTKVLGTSFNIRALDTDAEITVSVKTGKVSVYAKESSVNKKPSDPFILTPNQEVVFNRKEEKIVKQLVEKPEIILEHPTIFEMHYQNTPVSEIFDMIESNYGIEIQYDSEKLKGCVLTTNMSDEGLFERIHIICKAINATYSMTDAVIIIESQGCN